MTIQELQAVSDAIADREETRRAIARQRETMRECAARPEHVYNGNMFGRCPFCAIEQSEVTQ